MIPNISSQNTSNPSPTKSVAILVDPSINSGINQSLTIFQNDLAKEGYSVIVHLSSEKTPDEVRNYLKNLYLNTQPKLVGAILIGNISKPYYKIYYPATNISLERGPYVCVSTGFYEDLDGNYSKAQPADYFYSNHTGNVESEIWVSVFPYYFDNATTISSINGYLHKNHIYRYFENRTQRGYADAILGTMTSMEMYQSQMTAILDPRYYWYPINTIGNVLIGVDNNLGNRTLYPSALDVFEIGLMSSNYDFLVVGAHGSGYGWYYPNGTCLIDVNWAKSHSIQTHFIIDGSCSNGDIDMYPNLLTEFLYNKDNKILFEEGATCPAGGLGVNIEGYWSPVISGKLVQGYSFGEAFQYYLSKTLVDPYAQVRESVIAQHILLGDGTLLLVESPSPTPTPSPSPVPPPIPETPSFAILTLLLALGCAFMLVTKKKLKH
jgi:hypothetical protein